MEITKDPGELGRSLAQRRRELGLTHAQVARRARLTEGYVRHVEEQPADIAHAALWRLAAALETTPRQLLGAGSPLLLAERRPGEAEATLGR
ncbi:MAG TPA: helix-turn-helix domain-containing protein [Jiangellaceae bacterium]|jgi:transcriptional regulator with XRE-family HTH domain|nr:helix-turn-helix domain-containing protein [Jiangellaceae bacterium]